MAKKHKPPKNIETIRHKDATRKNIPTAEYQSVMRKDEQHPVQVAYERRNRDLDPQLVWRGKDEQDWSDLVVHAPPLYIQEKVHPKALIDDLRRETEQNAAQDTGFQTDLFGDFNGLPDEAARTEFYRHDANWSNRMILGDSLQVMASLAEREGLRGKVQCIYFDPPYGIKFNSNFQWSTTSRDVKDGKADHITREPEQVKAFRDTWRDGIHSYLTYLRDRLTVARDLLTDSGSIFVQIGDENVHRVRALMDEVFGEENFVALITVQKTGGLVTDNISQTLDFIVWYSKGSPKTRSLYWERVAGDTSLERYNLIFDELGNSRPITKEEKIFGYDSNLYKRGRLTNPESENPRVDYNFQGKTYNQKWKTNLVGLERLSRANRLQVTGKRLNYRRYIEDFPVIPITDRWESMQIGTSLVYVVQTSSTVVQNCILMTTDPGDLVLDPTCGSGTTAYVAEQWGRRWMTIDTSRVALALARARIMGARYPYYLLADSREGQHKEAELSRSVPSDAPTYHNIRQGFVYQRVPHIMLKSIANNAEIDEIWQKYQEHLEPLRQQLNQALGTSWEEWEIPRETPPQPSPKGREPDSSSFGGGRGEVSEGGVSQGGVPRFYHTSPENWQILKDFARDNRKHQTPAEEILWQQLRKKQLGYRFRRQHAIDDFIVDFVCVEKKLVVEVDGEIHERQQAYDQARTDMLGHYQFRVLRFWNREVEQELPRVLEQIREALTDPTQDLPPAPSEGGGDSPPLRGGAGGGVSNLHAQWWKLRIARQQEIDASIAAKADYEYLYDKPYEDKKTVRVAGPFTVDSLSPHRVLGVDEDDELIDPRKAPHPQPLPEGEERTSPSPSGRAGVGSSGSDFVSIILENLKTAGVQQAHKEDKINFVSITPWPGERYICAEARYVEGDIEMGAEKRAGIFIGPEFGTVSRPDLVAATREAGDAGFDVLIACAFNYEAHASDFRQLGRIPVLKARMNADLHMADELKNTGKGNLFVIFGEPDIEILDAEDNQIQVKIIGIDVFHPNTGEVRSDGPDGIACWFIDTDYNEESFFVRHAYFLGANDPYKALKTTLKAEIDKDAWDTLHSDTSRPFAKPASGRIAVKVINHLGDEVMKVYRIE